MKNLIYLILFLVNIFTAYSQDNRPLKKFRCFKNMPKNIDDIKNVDTIFVIYQKSNEEKFEQSKTDIAGTEYRRYNFGPLIYFPMEIFEYDNFERRNFQEPAVFYRKKSFLCKNTYRTIDVYFLQKWGWQFILKFYDQKKTIFFLIDLDSKTKGKYKIVQVNTPVIVSH